MKLKELRNIPFSLSMLDMIYPAHNALAAKAARIEKSSEIIRLRRDLYIVNPDLSGKNINEFLVANHIYGPSYVSCQSALRYYGLIPERVYEITSMTTRLTKTYTNQIGRFSYVHCSDPYYKIGIRNQKEDGVSFYIASPEKALCDLMIFTPHLNLRYRKEIKNYLEYDIRLEMSELKNFDLEILRECRDIGRKKTMLSQLIEFIERNE